jgi:hypothetical protein
MAAAGRPWASALATLLEAAIAGAEGDRARERTRLEQALVQLVAADMGLHAAVARRRLGALLGGSEGQAMGARTDEWMGQQGIRQPERMSAILLPGARPGVNA